MSTTNTLGFRRDIAVTVPLLSASLTVFYAIMEGTIFYCFKQSAKRDLTATAKVMRNWWNAFLVPGVSLIFLVTIPGIAMGTYNLRYFQQDAFMWNTSAAGATFTLGHFVFAPSISKVIFNLCDEEVERRGKTIENVQKWLNIHYWRCLFADLPALACFAYVAFATYQYP